MPCPLPASSLLWPSRRRTPDGTGCSSGDHVRWREPVLEVADAWITLAAIAFATRAIRLGPVVTPLARRLPVQVARETASLDRLSGGRLTLGVGLGDEQAGNEYSITGEELDERRRARMLDESLEILTAAWTGEPVHHRGEHYVVDGMRFLSRPVQRPEVPIWVAGRYGEAQAVAPSGPIPGILPGQSRASGPARRDDRGTHRAASRDWQGRH